MATKKEIDKVIELKENFEVRFKGELCYGFGNCGAYHPRILVAKDFHGYIIYEFNTNEYGHLYDPHGEVIVKIQNGMISEFVNDNYEGYLIDENRLDEPYLFTTPWGWNETHESYLTELVRTLIEEA